MQKTKLLIKSLSRNTTQNWRTQINHKHLVSQISSILEQRHNWSSLLQTLNLKSNLTPSLFLQIINSKQIQPQIALHFFNWATHNTSFQPNLLIQCRITHLLIRSGLVDLSKPVLNSLLENNPPVEIAQSLIKSYGKDSDFCTPESLVVFNCVIEWYCKKGLCFRGLEIFNLTRDLTKSLDENELFSRSCNTLLNALYENNEAKLGLCFYGVMIRQGVSIDQFTLRTVARIFGIQAKVDSMLRMIDTGINDPIIFDLVIESCSDMGRFQDALHLFDEMSSRKLNPRFTTFAPVLNAACRYNNDEMIKFAIESMEEKGYIAKPLIEHDSVIQKLCDMRKAYAANMLFKKACDEHRCLENKTYGYMLRALSMETLLTDAMEIHRVIEHKRIQVNPVFYNEFVNNLCIENGSKEGYHLLKDLISKGYKPASNALSKYITFHCKKRRWKEAEELAELAQQESIFLEPSCCGLLVMRYCKSRRIDLALDLHYQMVKRDCCMDSRTYTALVTGLLEGSRVKEAEKIFDYMKVKNLVTSESFVIMIDGFCGENDLKKAMKLHDEMMEMGLKPSSKIYKRLIRNFG